MSKRKILAIVLVLAMVLALPVVAMADSTKPVATTTTNQPSEIQSVTIGEVTASYQVDGYGNPSNPTYDNTQVFIRAMLPATSLEEDLKEINVTVVMTTGNTITGGSILSEDYDYTPATRTYVFYDVDMFNTAYTLEIGDDSYIVAAGLNDSNRAHVLLPPISEDSLAISGFKYGTGNDAVNAEVYRITIQNPCMGNPFFNNNNQSENGWTFCNYYIKAINVDGSNLSATDISFTKDSDVSVSGDISNVSGSTNVTAKANLSVSSPKMTVSNNDYTRTYDLVALVPSTGMMYVTYGFNFDELRASNTYYTNNPTVKAKADQIANDAASYFNGTFDDPRGVIEVPVGCTAMYVVQEFMRIKGYSEYDADSSYISSINGLAAFDTTGMDGWMYSDSSGSWNYNWHLPGVGADGYYLSAGDHITWFFTLDFTLYTNW